MFGLAVQSHSEMIINDVSHEIVWNCLAKTAYQFISFSSMNRSLSRSVLVVAAKGGAMVSLLYKAADWYDDHAL